MPGWGAGENGSVDDVAGENCAQVESLLTRFLVRMRKREGVPEPAFNVQLRPQMDLCNPCRNRVPGRLAVAEPTAFLDEPSDHGSRWFFVFGPS
jgi:hypothetical protein